MSLLHKIERGCIALLLIALVALGLYAKSLSLTKAAAQEDYHVASGDVSAAETHASRTVSNTIERGKANVRMDEALEANPEWATAPVPDAVADLLCHRCDAAAEVPAGDADHPAR